MSRKRAIRRAQCDGKTRYVTQAEAEARMRAIQRKHYQGRMSVYRCPFCNGFHFGHTPLKVIKAMQR